MNPLANAPRLVFPLALCVALACSAIGQAKDLLVVDRLSNAVFRYDSDGNFKNTVIQDDVLLNQPSGLVVSPDNTKLYVSSSQSDSIIRYDYNQHTGLASNGAVFVTGAQNGVMFPNSLIFNATGDKLFVSNLGGTGVMSYDLNGNPAGAPLYATFGGGAFFQYSGMTYDANGDLIVAAFQDFPGGTMGAIGKVNDAGTAIDQLVAPSTSLNGAAGLLVHGNDLYATGLFAFSLQRFDATTGAVDPSFNVAPGYFPQGLAALPTGDGFLVGVLGFNDGEGRIDHHKFDGTLVGLFAQAIAPNTPNAEGFEEATAFTFVAPEPTTAALMCIAFVAAGCAWRRRNFG